MSRNFLSLLSKRRFAPLFWTQFLGAFNDNVYKNALVILIAYRIGATVTDRPEILVTLAAGIFILPFFLFSATAGLLADKFDKAYLIRLTKLSEIIIMALGASALWLGNVWVLLFVLFLMGAQSAFFGPLKYAILPDHLHDDELLGGNALVEAATFVAILLGTVAGGVLVLREQGILVISGFCLLIAVTGYGASLFIPKTRAAAPGLRISFNFLGDSRAIWREVRTDRVIRNALFGISWFWYLGATFLAQFPNLVKNELRADEGVVVLFLILFAVGIGLGSMAANLVLRGRVSVRLVPAAGVALAILGLGFYATLEMVNGGAARESLLSAPDFLGQGRNIPLMAALLLIAVAGGFYSVPLYALVQQRSPDQSRSRSIAALNILNSAFMLGSAIISAVALALGLGVGALLAVTSALTLPVALWLRSALED